MPEERGSIYKSTANEIGEALKAKLGGEGFAPKDWSENLNLLGIASEDTEAAINSLKESEGSGERCSILLSTANAIGSMLNKKYNSSRGFSPAEWASATRKMKALETDTKSGGIVNLKGAKEVPITSLAGTINPTLEGTDTLVVTRLGKNLLENTLTSQTLNGTTFTVNSDKTITISGTPSTQTRVYIHSGEFYKTKVVSYFSCGSMPSGTRIFCQKTSSGGTSSYPTISPTTTLDDIGATYNNMLLEINTTFDGTPFTIQPMIEVGSEATDYTTYVAPTTYTANLGRTIYGGSADIVKGEGVEGYGIVDLGTLTWTKRNTSSGHWRFTTQDVPVVINDDASHVPSMVCAEYTAISPTQSWNGIEGVSCNTGISQLMVCDESYETASDFTTAVSGVYLVYPLANYSDFTFDPIPINTSGDTENFYTSHGDTAITYYEAPTPYTRGSASGGIASFSGANTEFPLTKLKATIAPSVEGVSRVVVKNEGKNLLDFSAFSDYSNWKTDITENQSYPTSSANRGLLLDLPQGTYTVTFGIDSETYPTYLYLCKDDGSESTRLIYFTGANFSVSSGTFTVDGSSKYYLRMGSTGTEESFNGQVEKISFCQIEVGSSATQFEPYKQPTTYTAELGETVYGGSVDFVSGEVKDSNDNTFYIDPQEIYPREGVNNIWNDANGDTEVTYFEEE